jgi:hypothetical protein
MSVCTEDKVPVNYWENEDSIPKASSYFLPKVKELLKDSINALSPSTPFEEEDETAVATLIFEAMYTKGRVYHSMQHCFNIIEHCDSGQKSNPMLILSILFHDVIYYSVDKFFQKSQLELLESILVVDDEAEGGTELKLLSTAQDDPLNDMAVRLFGLEAGMTLPKFGTNEFLSAMVGIHALSKWLSHTQLTQLAAAIEGTIPFRPASADGKTAMDRLYDQLVIVAPNQSEEWLTETIHLSALMANCDLGSFDASDFDFFMDSNWSLVPEFRSSILKEDCPLVEYHREFLAMEGRTKFLLASVPNIFQVFRNVPSESELAHKQSMARANLNRVDEWAQVRRLQSLILMEIVTIVGENPDTIPGRPFLDLVLPETEPYSADDDDGTRKLLHDGRNMYFPWDPSRCSLGTFLYDKLGKAGVDTAVEVGKKSEFGSYGLLNHLPKDVVEAIVSSFADVLSHKSDVLTEIPNKLGVCEK